MVAFGSSMLCLRAFRVQHHVRRPLPSRPTGCCPRAGSIETRHGPCSGNRTRVCRNRVSAWQPPMAGPRCCGRRLPGLPPPPPLFWARPPGVSGGSIMPWMERQGPTVGAGDRAPFFLAHVLTRNAGTVRAVRARDPSEDLREDTTRQRRLSFHFFPPLFNSLLSLFIPLPPFSQPPRLSALVLFPVGSFPCRFPTGLSSYLSSKDCRSFPRLDFFPPRLCRFPVPPTTLLGRCCIRLTVLPGAGLQRALRPTTNPGVPTALDRFRGLARPPHFNESLRRPTLDTTCTLLSDIDISTRRHRLDIPLI